MWLALDARWLKRQQKSLSWVYDAALRSELAGRLGLGWQPVPEGAGQTDPAGVPEGLGEVFSKRSRQVEGKLAELIARWTDEHDGTEPGPRELYLVERRAVTVGVAPHRRVAARRCPTPAGRGRVGRRSDAPGRSVDQPCGGALRGAASNRAGRDTDAAGRPAGQRARHRPAPHHCPGARRGGRSARVGEHRRRLRHDAPSARRGSPADRSGRRGGTRPARARGRTRRHRQDHRPGGGRRPAASAGPASARRGTLRQGGRRARRAGRLPRRHPLQAPQRHPPATTSRCHGDPRRGRHGYHRGPRPPRHARPKTPLAAGIRRRSRSAPRRWPGRHVLAVVRDLPRPPPRGGPPLHPPLGGRSQPGAAGR
jgi:hypothetical protein